jgi:hypothetical protein
MVKVTQASIDRLVIAANYSDDLLAGAISATEMPGSVGTGR